MAQGFRLLLTIALLLPVACAQRHPSGSSQSATGVAWQNSTIDALLDGNYDGDVSFGQLRAHGDFGLGTFDALDGEMLMLDGKVYQVRSDGSVSAVDDVQLTPFSVVTFFRSQRDGTLIGPLSYDRVQRILDDMRGLVSHNSGRAFAIRIAGQFESVRTRSVPRQEKPYRPLAQVVKGQATFDFKDVRGTLVGFWFPETMRHVNVPGYHFHFVTEDGKAGGHVLDLNIRSGVVAFQELSAVHIELPRRAPVTRPATDRAVELRAVEQ
jgi:acetolactate decarboxylase